MKVRLDVYDGQYRNNVQRMTFYWTGLDCLGLHQFLALHGSFQRHPIASAPVMSELVNQPDIPPVRLEAYYMEMLYPFKPFYFSLKPQNLKEK